MQQLMLDQGAPFDVTALLGIGCVERQDKIRDLPEPLLDLAACFGLCPLPHCHRVAELALTNDRAAVLAVGDVGPEGPDLGITKMRVLRILERCSLINEGGARPGHDLGYGNELIAGIEIK